MRLPRLTLVGGFLMAATLSGTASAADVYDRAKGSFKDEPVAFASSGFYATVRGGATFPQDTDFNLSSLPVNVENQYDDAGYLFSGAIGYEFAKAYGGAFRVELELGYFKNEIEAHKISGALNDKFSGRDAFGETSAFYGLASLYYDFASFGRIKPFIGGGIGFAKVDFDNHGVSATGVVLDDSDTGFAYQASAGANITLTDKVDLEIGYRFLGVTDVELRSSFDGTKSDVDVQNHVVYGGLKVRL